MESQRPASSVLPERRIGPRTAGCIGLGCVPGSGYYGRSDAGEMKAVIRSALDVGVNFIDTADNYALGENEKLVGQAIRGRVGEAVLATKGGLDAHATAGVDRNDLRTFDLRPNGRPEHLREALEGSLRRLGVDCVDIYYLHRLDSMVPIEESVGVMSEFVAEGKARSIGLCEVGVDVLDRAHEVHPVASVQSEMSLWTREPLETVVPWCAEHDATFVPYAPLGRGFLTGKVSTQTALAATDFRGDNPRFQPEAIEANAALIDAIRRVAERHEATVAQVALGWLLHQGPHILPIPGMERVEYLHDNVAAAHLALDAEDLAALDQLPQAVGDRYAAAAYRPDDD